MNDEKKKKGDKYTRGSEYPDRAEFSAAASAAKETQSPDSTTDAVDEISALKEELESTKAKAAEYFDGWQRERADFQNYKRRIERDQITRTQEISGRIIKKYLAVQDDIARALKNRPTTAEAATWAEGIELVNRKLISILESENITRIEAENQLFDPTIHEALSHEDSGEHESGQIIEVIQQGYMLGDRVIRPALVRVAR